jgi:tetratricopeptide (TPR) repeat protein
MSWLSRNLSTASTLARSHSVQIVFLALLAVLPYLGALDNGFVYDDRIQVLANPYVQRFRFLPQVFTTSVWSFQGAVAEAGHLYRPLMTITYLLGYKLFGPQAYFFHLFNLCLHTGIVALLFLATLRLSQDSTMAFLSAAIFALHPVHTESVAWIAAVTDLEVTFFLLLTLWFFLQISKARSRRGLALELAMAGSFSLALLSKEQAVMFPILATVYEHWYRSDRNQTSVGEKLARYGVLWWLDCAYLLARVRMFGVVGGPSATMRPHIPISQVLLSATVLFGEYVGKLFWPIRLSAYYGFHPITHLLSSPVLFGVLAIVSCVTAFWVLEANRWVASYGIIWFILMLAPTLNVRWLGGDNAFAERYLYLPSVGFAWVIGELGSRAWKSSYLPSRVLLSAAAALIGTLCAWRVVTRVPDWGDEVALFRGAVEISPEVHGSHFQLGRAYAKEGDLKSAEDEFRQAFQYAEDDGRRAYALGALSEVYEHEGRYQDALRYGRRAVELYPSSKLQITLGFIELSHFGLNDEAEKHFGAAVAMAPLEVQAYEGLGLVYWKRGIHDKAEAAFRRSISIRPFDVRSHMYRGEFYESTGRTREAIGDFKAVLALEPANSEARAALDRLISQTTLSR